MIMYLIFTFTWLGVGIWASSEQKPLLVLAALAFLFKNIAMLYYMRKNNGNDTQKRN